MRSRVDGPARAALETALRVAALAALGTVLWRWTRPPVVSAAPVAEVVASSGLDDALGKLLGK